MYTNEQQPKASTPCALCRAPATFEAWGFNLCDEHHAQWTKDSPTCGDIEKAAPEADVLGRHQLKHPADPANPWVVTLKAGVLERELTAWTAKWVVKCRSDRARTALAAPRSDERGVRP